MRRSMIMVVLLCALSANAKRLPPDELPPVVSAGVRYVVPHSAVDNPCKQNGGCVVALDDATGNQLWFVQVYCTRYDTNLEQDVQDVYITSLTLEGDHLVVTDEKNRRFTIDVSSHAVTGAARGCGVGGCSAVPGSSLAGILAVALISRRRRRSTR